MTRTAPYYVPEVAWSAELTGVFRADISLCDGPDVAAGTFGNNTYDSLPQLLSADVSRGRSQAWTGVEQGTCRMTVSDPTGIYDPTNVASPLYGLLDDMRPARLREVGAVQTSGAAAFARASTAYMEEEEEGTTNLASNGSFEVDTAGWTGVLTMSLSRDSGGVVGAYCAKLIGAQNDAFRHMLPSLVHSTTYTLTYWIKGSGAVVVPLVFNKAGGGWNVYQDAAYSATSTWTKHTFTFITAADCVDGTAYLDCVRFGAGGGAVWVDGVQLEAKPYATSFTDGTRPYTTLVASGVPRFETIGGRTGVMVEEGTTNLKADGSNESAASLVTYGTHSTVTRTTDEAHSGSYSLKVELNASAASWEGAQTTAWTVAVTTLRGKTLTVSIWFKRTEVVNNGYRVSLGDSDGTNWEWVNGANSEKTADWQRIVATKVIQADATSIQVTVNANFNGAVTFYLDDLQLQEGVATTYTDTTRAAETVTIPTAGVLSAAEGTVEFAYCPNNTPAASHPLCILFDAGPDTGSLNAFRIYGNTNGSVWVIYGDGVAANRAIAAAAGALTGGAWTVITVSWGAAGVTLYVNGAKIGTSAFVWVPSLGSGAYIGRQYNIAQRYANGLISDLRISSRARTDAEIAVAYQRGLARLPMEVDISTTGYLPLSSNLVGGGLALGTSGLFYGFTTSIEHHPDLAERTTTIDAVDFTEWLAGIKPVIASTGPITVGAAMGLILDYAEWTDASMRSLDAGNTIPDFSADGSKTGLAIIGELIAVDLGMFFVDGDGVVTYRDRNSMYRHAPPVDVFGSDVLSRLQPKIDSRAIINRQTVTRTGGVPQVAANNPKRKPWREGSLTSPYLNDDTDAANLATWITLYSGVVQTPIPVEIPDVDDVQIASIVSRELADVVTVALPHGGTTDGVIQRLSHSVVKGHHVLTATVAVRPITAFTADISLADGPDVASY